jgi:NADP-dependent 3-hydroxy acid dehydrogenase YdfG
MVQFSGKTAVITGASRGIGKAIAIELAGAGAILCLIGRNRQTLEETAHEGNTKAIIYQTDLSDHKELEDLARFLKIEFKRVDALVHSAGIYSNAGFATASIKEFDQLFAVNVRAPFRLTQVLLTALLQAKGQVVFINSLAGRAIPKAMISQYSATKYALRALADALREEMNQAGIRVISVYPGRTAGDIQERLFELEGLHYEPERLLQPKDVARAVFSAIIQPPNAEITDIFIRPSFKIKTGR